MNTKGMSPFVTVVLSLAVIAVILYSSFGPGSSKKFVDKAIFENKEIIPGIEEDEELVPGTVVGDSLPPVRISGSKTDIVDKVARELASCWREMKEKSAQNLKCANLCFCKEEPCKCRTLKEKEEQVKGPLISLESMMLYLRELEDNSAEKISGAADELRDNWGRSPPLAWTNVLTSDTEQAVLKYAGIFDNVNYMICADYDRGDVTGDDLFITDDFSFNCE